MAPEIRSLQQTAGNKSVTHLLGEGGSNTLMRRPLTAEEQALNLQNPRYAGNQRLQDAFDNHPPINYGETGDAVAAVQQGMIDDGLPMPLSTNNGTTPPDGIYGPETLQTIRTFQANHSLDVDGSVGRQTMGKLDELAGGAPQPPEPEPPSTVDFILEVLSNAPQETLTALRADATFLNSLQSLTTEAQFGRAAAYLVLEVPAGVVDPAAAKAEAVRILSTQLAGDKATTRRAINSIVAVIVPSNQLMTDLPQFASLRGVSTFDGRTWDVVRGVGNLQLNGKRYTAITEENLLGTQCTATFNGNPVQWEYAAGYSTTSHEFAHSMHGAALTDADRQTITAAYTARKALATADPTNPDMWVDGREGCYASQTEFEFYAQLSNAYLGTNAGTDPGTGDPRQNTKDWVQSHEPTIFAILERVYAGGALANTNPRFATP
jgi:peptidoglycan hydrolase-like protein with peptidoglycan-binding domain